MHIYEKSRPTGKVSGIMANTIELKQQIAQGKKSVSYSISMRSHDGTLTDEQADGAMKRVLKALKAMGAELRM